MKKIKLPNPIILFFGSIGAFWIADIIHPGFNPIAVMILLLIPVLVVEILYPQPELEQLMEQAIKEAAIKEESIASIDDETATEKT